MVRYALSATPHSRGTSGDASESRREPSTHSVTNTVSRTSRSTTTGAQTASRPRAFIDAANPAVFLA